MSLCHVRVVTSAGASAMAGGSLAAGASAALAAVPVWGWIALAALALGGSMVTGGTPHLGGAYVAGTDGTGFKADNANYSNFGLDWGAYNSDRNAGMDGATKSLAEGIAGSLGGILGKFGLDNYYQVGVRFASDGEDRSPGAIRITNQAGEIVAEVAGKFNKSAQKGLEELAAKAGEAIQKTLLDADLPAWAEDTLKALGDTPSIDQLNTALASISQFEAAAGAITDAIGISTDAVYGITKAFGGLSAAGAALSNYYQLFYSDAERTADARAQLADQFEALGQAMPENNAAFRALVESIDTTTTAGQQLYAQLITLASPFAAVTDAAATAGAAIAQEALGLQKQVWKLTGDTASLRAAELAEIDPANRALQERVWALEDEQAAQQAMASAIAGVSSASASAVDSLASLSDALRSALGTAGDETAAVTAAARARAQAQLGAALAIAKASGGSVLPDEAAISGALSTVSASSTGMFGSYEDYLRDRLRTANTIAGLANIVDTRRGIPGFASGGYHSGGWRVVGELGPELEYTGASKIVSNSDTKSLLNLDELLREIRELREDMRSGHVAIVRGTDKLARTADQWNNEGMPAVRT